MKIGELAAASGCHVESIRHYERIGLMPRPGRSGSGYRRYTPADVRRARFIINARDLRFSLKEIQGLLALAEDPALSCSDVDTLARGHLDEIRQRIAELEHMAKVLEATIASCGEGLRSDCAILDALQEERPRPGGGRRAESVHGPL